MALAGRLDRAVRPRLPAAGRNHHLTTSPRARAEESEKPADRRDRHARNQPAPIEDQLIRGKINSPSFGGSRLSRVVASIRALRVGVAVGAPHAEWVAHRPTGSDTMSAGMIGQSSTRVMWWIPNTYQSTTSVFS